MNEDEELAENVFNHLAQLNSWHVREAVSDSGFKLKNKKIAEDILIGYYNESLKKMIVNLKRKKENCKVDMKGRKKS